ncbi:MAG: aromatic aminobenezylarsenical efflux permease ArsG family transporter [Bacteroidales bacterium]|nr:aromatic aminobenezylarsenical efflux permease ArsG family transporter [Bacteroidales bacterium]
MDFLNQLLDSSQVPTFTAFLLGLLTALSPCPLATNVTAIGYISRNGGDATNGYAVLWRGVLYTLGRIMAYTVLGAILIFAIREGTDTFKLQQFVSEWGERLLGPALVVVGILMLLAEFVEIGGKFGFKGGRLADKQRGAWGSMVLGLLFALTFCPTSGLLYFGMLIPMSAESSAGYLLPLVYAVATALPVLLVAWLLAYSVNSIGKVMGKISAFQKWFNRLVALVFVGVGIYYSAMIFL